MTSPIVLNQRCKRKTKAHCPFGSNTPTIEASLGKSNTTMDTPSELEDATMAVADKKDEDSPMEEDVAPELEEPDTPPAMVEEPEDDAASKSSTDETLEDEGVSPEKAELILIKATGLKEEGNSEFKNGDLDKASRSYRRAVNSLKKLNKNNTGDNQVKALLVTLYTNLSTVSFKSKKYRVSSEVAGQAIAIDGSAVKALYRRAVAHRAMGDLEKSRTDLRAAISFDPDNKACKKELIGVKKDLGVAKQTQQKALAKAFGTTGGGGFLYNDKEEAEKRKQKEERERKQREEEELKTLKKLWEDETVSRMAKGEDAISFEDWSKERKEKEKAERKKAEKERKEAARRRREAEKAAKMDKADSDSDDDKLTEAELQQLRGYKKTSDGRTTSYFTRELSEDEKKRIGDIAPKRLDSPAVGPQPVSNTDASKWNQAGTWEEKDTTTWCTSQLRTRLEECSVTEEAFDADVTSVDDLTGHASVATVAGKKRYIFDFHVKLHFEVKQADKVLGKGTIKLPDICSGTVDEMEVEYSWKQRPVTIESSKVQELLTTQLRANVQVFVTDFNAMY